MPRPLASPSLQARHLPPRPAFGQAHATPRRSRSAPGRTCPASRRLLAAPTGHAARPLGGRAVAAPGPAPRRSWAHPRGAHAGSHAHAGARRLHGRRSRRPCLSPRASRPASRPPWRTATATAHGRAGGRGRARHAPPQLAARPRHGAARPRAAHGAPRGRLPSFGRAPGGAVGLRPAPPHAPMRPRRRSAPRSRPVAASRARHAAPRWALAGRPVGNGGGS